MKKLTILRFWLSVVVLLVWATLSLAQNQPVANKPSLKLTLVQDADGVFVTSADAVSEFVFEAFLLSGQRAFANTPTNGNSLKLRLQNVEGKPLPDGQYLYVATIKVSPTAMVKYFGKLTLQSGQAEMQDSSEVLGSYERHYFAQRNLSFAPDAKQEEIDQEFRLFQTKADEAVALFDLAVKLIPNSAEALLGQGFAVAATAGLTVSQMTDVIEPQTPLPPPPPAPVGIAGKRATPPAAREPNINREGLLRAIDAFKQGILVIDCESRSEAMLFLSAIYSKLNDMDQARDWRLKSVEMNCATSITRSMAYYSLAVENWRCANAITESYTDQKHARLDLWYPRQITSPTDREKLNTCLAQGLEYIEKALFDAPDNSKAVFYQSLLYLEKQKTAKLKAERLQYAALAEKAAQRAMELFERERQKP